MSSGPTLWGIDTANTLCSVKDPIATAGPTLKAPAEAAAVAVNVETGKAYDVSFTWERYSNKYITKCELEVATDSDFDGKVYS